MKQVVVWVDRFHVKLFLDLAEQAEPKTFEWRPLNHHTHAIDSLETQKGAEIFYRSISSEMALADEILVVGPGIGKFHFRNTLIEHFPNIAKKIVGCESIDHCSDAQILRQARHYYESRVPLKAASGAFV